MFQDYALFPHMNVAENVAFGLRMQQVDAGEIKRRVDEALELVNMRAFADRRVTDLSGGEQQRVALARALVPQPRLLMLDEPLGALDRALREQLSRDLRQVLDRMDIPVIYVTHDQEEAFTIADRILVLHDGRIIQSGSPQQVYNRPASLWLAAFFGQKNNLPGTVNAVDPLTVRTDYGELVCNSAQGDWEMGQPVTLLIPFTAVRVDGDADNAIQAQVKHVSFQGVGFMIDFLLIDGKELTFFSDRSLPAGEHVTLSIDAKSILCFK
jgi:ABC-type Fe3+/spermidine/putrescine transport system ATPase subunit